MFEEIKWPKLVNKTNIHVGGQPILIHIKLPATLLNNLQRNTLMHFRPGVYICKTNDFQACWVRGLDFYIFWPNLGLCVWYVHCGEGWVIGHKMEREDR